MVPRREPGITLGLRANAGQFALLVGVSALVGGMVGQERAIVPLLGFEVFGLSTTTAALAFLVAFGLTKAVTNLVAGALADRVGRKPVLVAGWLVGLPGPVPLLILAPDWGWVVVANILLGVNQGLTWSTTVLMKVDLVGPRRRGFALGLNEASGYLAVAITAFLTGLIAESAGLRPAPFFLGIAIVGLGLGASVLFVRETRHHVATEVGSAPPSIATGWPALAWRSTVGDPSLSSASQAGLVNNLNDGLAWGLLPIVQAAAGLSVGQIGVLAAAYPATWGLAQIATGALSDRVGRKRLIVAGMLTQAVAIASIAAWTGFVPWLLAAVVPRDHGVPDPPGGRRRRRGSPSARRRHGRLPILARPGFRRRCAPRRCGRGPGGRRGRDRDRGCLDRGLRRRRGVAHGRDAPDGLSLVARRSGSCSTGKDKSGPRAARPGQKGLDVCLADDDSGVGAPPTHRFGPMAAQPPTPEILAGLICAGLSFWEERQARHASRRSVRCR